jgi:hypothetical protein
MSVFVKELKRYSVEAYSFGAHGATDDSTLQLFNPSTYP